jgi:hypothetical protein
MYVYIQSEPGLFTVGFYDPFGKWQPESDHQNREMAAVRVATLNGNTAAVAPGSGSGHGEDLPGKIKVAQFGNSALWLQRTDFHREGTHIAMLREDCNPDYIKLVTDEMVRRYNLFPAYEKGFMEVAKSVLSNS